MTETYSHLTLAHDLKYISDDIFVDLKNRIDELLRMINGYIAYLKRSKRGEHEPGVNTIVRESSSEYVAEIPDSSQEP